MRVRDQSDMGLLTALIIGEAAGEPFTDKLAVACVVKNRVHDVRWPDTWKGVILQRQQFSSMNSLPRNGEVQLFWRHRYFTNYWTDSWWRECRFAAFGLLNEWYQDFTHGANHYYEHRLIETPYWARGVDPVYIMGGHWFYRL